MASLGEGELFDGSVARLDTFHLHRLPMRSMLDTDIGSYSLVEVMASRPIITSGTVTRGRPSRS